MSVGVLVGTSVVLFVSFIALHPAEGGSISTNLGAMQIRSRYDVTWYERAREGDQSRQLAVKIGACTGDDISPLHTVPDWWEKKSAQLVATSVPLDLCLRKADRGVIVLGN